MRRACLGIACAACVRVPVSTLTTELLRRSERGRPRQKKPGSESKLPRESQRLLRLLMASLPSSRSSNYPRIGRRSDIKPQTTRGRHSEASGEDGVGQRSRLHQSVGSPTD
ncbi:hypothetical protein LZ31DRAFT_197250 [Colletotrichum somersetense]|nr:hypothetical protein LZ31DRAFT_197250 [Colletotrichum somersetense]